MTGFVAQICIWTAKNQVSIADDDLSCHSYREKDGSALGFGSQYVKERRNFFESRNRVWALTNKRPEKLRDGFKEYEEQLQKNACITSRWLSPDVLMMILENGCILRVELASEYADICRVCVDTTLIGKLTVGAASDALLTDRYVAFVSSEKAKMDVFHFSKRADFSSRKFDKISTLEPVLWQVELPGRAGRAIQRRLSSSADHTLVLVWWPTAGTEAWPWTPVPSEAENANLAVVRVTELETAVICHTRADNEPLAAIFSHRETSPHREASHIFTVERLLSGKSSSTSAVSASRIQLCTYELTHNCLHRTGHTRLSLRGGICCCAAWNANETRLALASDEKHCMVFSDEGEPLAQTTVEFVPAKLTWHPTGCLIVIASNQGDVQVMDSGLNTLGLYLISSREEPAGCAVLHMSAYFRPDVRLQHLSWCFHNGLFVSGAPADAFLAVFESGPACVVRLLGSYTGSEHRVSHYSIITQHLKCGRLAQAVNLLSQLSWEDDDKACFSCLNAIVNHLFKLPLDRNNEGLIEAALGSFYAPHKPLPEVVILEYRDSIGRLARRFFHHLLRYSRYDKAYLLAVDIGSRDLFMDIHYSAQDKGNIELAAVALEKANQCKGGMLSTSTEVSSDDGISTDDSGEDDDSSAGSDGGSTTVQSSGRLSASSLSALWQAPPAALADPTVGLGSFPGYTPGHKLAASRQASTDSMRGPAPPLPPRRGQVPQQQPPPPVPPRHQLGRQQLEEQEQQHTSEGGATADAGTAAQGVPNVGNRTLHRHGPGITLPGYSYETDADLTNQLLDDYMALMVDDPLVAFRSNQSQPHDRQQQQQQQGPEQQQQMQEDGTRQAVKVIHFGVV